jgi:hypothetical protein
MAAKKKPARKAPAKKAPAKKAPAKKPPAKRKTARRKSSPTPDVGELEIRLPGRRVLPLHTTEELQSLAMRWAYRVRHRQNWSTTKKTRVDQSAEALHALEQAVGLTTAQLGEILDAGVAEVHIPFRTEHDGWAMRIFPWESMLAMAAKALNRSERFLVVRHLDCGSEPAPASPAGKTLVVTSAPGRLAGRYLFESEQALLAAAIGDKLELLANPSLAELAETTQRLRPRVVHFTGIDNHQGAKLLRLP